MKKRIIISLSVVVCAVLTILAGCAISRDTVTVRDAVSRSPIRGAQVVPVYPSFGGAAYTTDKRGVARVGGFGLPRGAAGYSVEVSAPGYERLSVPMFGSDANHLEVSLRPTPKP
jgi:hypothetical protein